MSDNISDIANWERATIEKLLFMQLAEQKRIRFWKVLFRTLIFLYVIFLTVMFFFGDAINYKAAVKEHAAVIEIKGVIAANTEVNADNIIDALDSAFKHDKAKAIVLKINSPGGSPVQARTVFNAMLRLKKKHNKKVYAVIEDIGASAAYLIAAGADEIYADETSFVGSIGAVFSSFGFTDLMQKLGVSRRLYASSEYKALLDPFSPLQQKDEEFIKKELEAFHGFVVANVKEGRGGKIKEQDYKTVFSGRIWNGGEALNLGLVDGFGDVYTVSADVIKTDNMIEYSSGASSIDKLFRKLSKRLS